MADGYTFAGLWDGNVPMLVSEIVAYLQSVGPGVDHSTVARYCAKLDPTTPEKRSFRRYRPSEFAAAYYGGDYATATWS